LQRAAGVTKYGPITMQQCRGIRGYEHIC
jgi:hypothetical protein